MPSGLTAIRRAPVSPDANTLTIAYKGSFEGQTYDNVEVFTRDK